MTSTGQKIIFSVDQPVAVALASDSGVLKEGKYGPYWTYFLDDDRIMFVPPMVAEQIQRLGITAGQKFIVTKTDERCGSGLRWDVSLPEPKQGNANDDLFPAEGAVHNKQDEKGGQEATNGGGAQPHAWPELIEPQATQAHANGSAPNGTNGKSNGHGNGTGNQDGNTNGVEPNASPLMKACLRAAIDAVIDAETYAASRSYHLRFSSEDVRAAGISVFIAAGNGGRR